MLVALAPHPAEVIMRVTCRHAPGMTTLAVGWHLSGSAIGERFTRVRALMRPQTSRRTACMARTRCPFSSQRRRAAAESGHIRLFPVTRRLTRRIESDYRRPEGRRCLDPPRCACRQLEPHHLVSHLILEPGLKIRIENLAELAVMQTRGRVSGQAGTSLDDEQAVQALQGHRAVHVKEVRASIADAWVCRNCRQVVSVRHCGAAGTFRALRTRRMVDAPSR